MEPGEERETLLQLDPPQEMTGEMIPTKTRRLGPAGKKKGNLPPLESKPSAGDVLHQILPPREFEENGRQYVQYVSAEAPDRSDVTQLKDDLDQKLMERQARDSGICPVREELYQQAFDELIRQITLECPERGILLMGVRDEIRMTVEAYQTLYASSVTFGTRKQLQSVQGEEEMEEQKVELEKRRVRLNNSLKEIENAKDALLVTFEERKKAAELERKNELDYLEHNGKLLENYLNNLDRPS